MQRIRSVGRNDRRVAGDPAAWAIQDKINEIRGKLTLKQRDQEAYYLFSEHQIKENELLIKSLRTEIHEKRIFRKTSLNADEHVIAEALKNHKESQLAMQRYSIAKAIDEKNEHVFDKIKALNAKRHERKKKHRRLKQLKQLLNDMKQAAKIKVTDENNQRIRVLMTSIDKMRLKYSSACFVQRTYLRILGHLERENLKLPGRLSALEQSIRNNRAELDGDLYQIQQDARKAYDNSKSIKEKMEGKILKEKRQRDTNLAEVRRQFKRMGQKEEREYKPRRKATKGQENGEGGLVSMNFWESIAGFWSTKRSMDQLTQSMSLSHPSDIAPCFQRHISRKAELEQAVKDLSSRKETWTAELKKYQEELTVISRAYNCMLEDTAIQTKEKTKAINALKEGAEMTKDRYMALSELLLDAVNAIGTVYQRTSTYDWVAKKIRQKQGHEQKLHAVASYSDLVKHLEFTNMVKVLELCGEKLSAMSRVKEYMAEQSISMELGSEEVQEILVDATGGGARNTRVCIADEDDLLLTESFFEDDDDLNDQYLSREVIKNTMLQFTENQSTKKRKRRAKNE